MKVLHAALAVATLALSFSSAAAAADTCIDDKAKQALACTGAGKTFDASSLKTGTGFHPTVPPAKAVNRSLSVPPSASNEVPRDDRKIRLEARVKGLLVTEVAKIESLFGTTRANAPDRLQIARRLADDYVELESASFRDKVEAEQRRDALKKKDPAKAGQEQTNANEAERTMVAARKRAIELYSLIARDYPNSPKLDEALYYLAYEYEQANDFKNARSTYYDLIKKTPTSHYIPNAYLAFGELFFNEAQGDPSKWDLAAQAYAEVVKYPAPQNKVQGYAFYKTAYVYWNKGEFEKALDNFKKTIDFGVANPTLPGASKLADSARRDLIPVYALKGDPKMAYAFLHNMSGEGSANDKTYRMMDDLGNAYLDTGHYPEGIVVYKDLISRDRGGHVCGYQARITEAVMAMRSGDKDAIKTELDSILKLAEASKSSPTEKDPKQSCGNRTAALITETAMAWHVEAIGSQNQRGTGDKKTMGLAAYLYKRTIDTFSTKELASYEFPRLIKEDWPTSFKIKYAMADLLYSQKDWAKCGPAFDAVVAEDPNGPEAPKSAYAAGLCYQAAYEEMHKGDAARRGIGQLPRSQASAGASAPLKPKEMSAEQVAMVRAFDRYVCTIKPAANDAATQAQLVEVKYARARTYFEAQHWDEAALAFRDIALNHTTHESAIYAAQLYLESANVLNRHFNKPSCEEDMSADVPRFIDLYCTAAATATKNADQCTTLKYVQVDLLRLRSQRYVERADKAQGKEAIDLYTQGGTGYFELFRTYCQDPVNAGGKPQAERCDEIAYNAAKAFQAARLLAKAITVRRALLAFDERTHLSSPLTKKSFYDIGANYQAIAVYDQAAEWFEKFARSDARAENADRALSDAVLLRLGLGQEAEAIKDADDFVRSYGASKPALAGSVAFAIGAHHAEKEEWEKARVALSGTNARVTIDRAPPDIQVQAHATLGRSLSHLGAGHAGQARTEYAKVRSLWSDPTSTEQKIRSAYAMEDDAQRDRRVGRTVTAVGEALFFFAEERKAAEVDTLRFPEYKGPGDKASVKAHVDGKVKDWYLKKMAAIQKVEGDYLKLLDLKPLPPPKWIIAAGSRAGLMWGDFVDDFRRAPIPKAWRGTEIEQVYTTAIDAASEPYKRDHAKPALKKCLDLSTQHQYFDTFSRNCEVWLGKNYKAEYHVVDELRGAPTLANSGLAEKAPPVLIGGAFYHAAPATPDKSAKADESTTTSTTTSTSPKPTPPRRR